MAAQPIDPSSTPRRASGYAWTPLAVAAIALVALAALVAGHDLSAPAGGAAAMMVIAAGAVTGLWVLGRQRAAARASAPEPAPLAAGASAPAGAAAAGGDHFAAVLNALPDPVLVVAGDEPDDLAGRRVSYVNAAARELFPSTREGAPLVTVIRDPKVLEIVDEALFGRVASETAYEAGGAQDRVWRAAARPLGAIGRRLALLTLRDETELRRSERTRADFLANASHELRTPLASLSGFIETLRGHARDDPAARDRFLAIMQDQAQRMARLIEDLMSLSRIELNEHIPPQGRADLGMTVKDVVDALGPLAAEKGVGFDLDLPDASAAVRPADRDQLLQVIQNLAENAVKYAPCGTRVRIEVSGEVGADAAILPRQPGAAFFSLLTPDRAADQRYVALRVRGEGPGIAREHLPRLTERFYRVEGQKGGDRAGTGLGLAIVKHIVNRHRGGLTVESAPGEGATFGVYLPAACEPAAARLDAALDAAPNA